MKSWQEQRTMFACIDGCGTPVSKQSSRCRACYLTYVKHELRPREPKPRLAPLRPAARPATHPCLGCGTPIRLKSRRCMGCYADTQARNVQSLKAKGRRHSIGKPSILIGEDRWSCVRKCRSCEKWIFYGWYCYLCSTGQARVILRPEERQRAGFAA